jgi:hypothetical protein
MADSSIDFDPFTPGFRYNPDSLLVHGMERPLTTLSEWLHPEVAELRTALGIPHDREIWRYQQWCPLGKTGYFFDVYGMREIPGDDEKAPRWWPHSPPLKRGAGYTARQEEAYPSLDNRPLIAVRRRVVYQHIPPWLEARWSRAKGTQLWLRGLDKDRLLTSARLPALKVLMPPLWRGVALLKALEVAPGGRTPLTTRYYPTPDAFHAAYREKHAEVQCQRPGERVRDEDLWEALGLSRTAFYDYVRNYRRPALL